MQSLYAGHQYACVSKVRESGVVRQTPGESFHAAKKRVDTRASWFWGYFPESPTTVSQHLRRVHRVHHRATPGSTGFCSKCVRQGGGDH